IIFRLLFSGAPSRPALYTLSLHDALPIWPTAYIEADPSTIDSNGRRSFKYTANKHIFQKEGVSEPEPGEIETGTITASGNITAFSDKRLKANIKPIAKIGRASCRERE